MTATNPNVLSVAGFDPSGGAGILADIKTFEAHRVNGMGVCTSLTFQHEERFEGVEWIPYNQIIQQIRVLEEKHTIDYVKIGLVASLDLLNELLDVLISDRPERYIVWDPVMKTSTGYLFHEASSASLLKKILNKVSLVTPNYDEAQILFKNLQITQKQLNEFIKQADAASFLLKSIHIGSHHVTDELHDGFQVNTFHGDIYEGYEKHGTGCVYSSAVLAWLATGKNVYTACALAKQYVERFMLSSPSKLGIHYNT